MYLRAGESYTLRELLEGLLLASGNDAALAIAGSLGGDAFIEQMNRKAEELGLTGSHFANPHGLDADGHRASAHDLGLIMAAALQNDVLAEILSQRSSCIHGVTYVNPFNQAALELPRRESAARPGTRKPRADASSRAVSATVCSSSA